jgi:hypothetical protein
MPGRQQESAGHLIAGIEGELHLRRSIAVPGITGIRALWKRTGGTPAIRRTRITT